MGELKTLSVPFGLPRQGAPENLVVEEGHDVAGASQACCYGPALPDRVLCVAAGVVPNHPSEEKLENDASADPAAHDHYTAH